MANESSPENPQNIGPVPRDWLPGLVENIRFDITAGFMVFLLALPLSLAIAVASGAPPVAGLVTAIVGGVLGSLMSGSYITINGPAAGLIAIVYGAVYGLGFDPATGEVDLMAGFRAALAVGVVCGIIQFGMGLARLGKMTNFFPLKVVSGMLAGIGLIIMVKQIHLALGVNVSGDMILTVAAIPSSFITMNPAVAAIGGISLLIMILWGKLGIIARYVPAPLVVVVVAIIIAKIVGLDEEFFVRVPLNVTETFLSPDWSHVATPLFWKFVIAYVFVASLESLLTATAMDKMDPWKRRSDMNRELIGKGAANALSSLIGGLPMIAEVVRSSANIMSGARTRWANFFHGTFLAGAVIVLPTVLNMIPLAALAGILLFIGFRLAHPKDFIRAARTGKEEFFYMVLTALLVLFQDLMVGVITGFVVALIVNIIRGVRSMRANVIVEETDDKLRLRLQGAFGFLNFLSVRNTMDDLARGRSLIIDFSEVTYMDHTVHEQFYDFEQEYTRTGGNVRVEGKEALHKLAPGDVSAISRSA